MVPVPMPRATAASELESPRATRSRTSLSRRVNEATAPVVSTTYVVSQIVMCWEIRYELLMRTAQPK